MKKLIGLIMLIIALASCSQPQAKPEIKVDESKKQIVFAVLEGADSQYKDELFTALSKQYADIAQVHKVAVKKYADLANLRYDALIVSEQLKAWLWLNGGLKSFFKGADTTKTFFVLTVGDEKWQYQGKVPNVFTSASQKESPERMKQEIDSFLAKTLSLEPQTAAE